MLLKVKDLNTYYGMSHVLQGISLTVGEGEIVALLGRNGMGKSTTLKSIMGLVKPKSGEVIFKGVDITGYPPYKAAKIGIGYCPEDRRIFPNLTVKDNLLMGIKGGSNGRADKGKGWDLERVYEYFPRLKERMDQRGSHLSGGEQQMLAIGRMLMGNPELLLVDEPTEGLAPVLIQEVSNMIAEIKKTGISILLVEHNIKVAMSLADHVYLMGKGHLGFSGTVQELEENTKIRAKYLEV